MPRRSSSARALRIAAFAALAVTSGTLLTGCSPTARADDGRLHVEASFYPLQFITQRIGGSLVEVRSLTRPGTEPHDLELTPRDVARLQDSDLVVYLSGFQPAVDEGIEAAGPPAVFDARSSGRLDLTLSDHGHAEHADEHAADEHAGHGDESGSDPHFWLDPTRLSDVAAALEQTMARLAPDDATTFATNLAALQRDLAALDGELEAGLADCASRDLVTSHTAFGYLAERYDLHQVGISGLDPESEPDPGELADVVDFVKANDVRTIYFETLVSPAVARTVARATGARTAVLDPVEGLTDQSAGRDYLEIMRANLASLLEGQPCR